MPTTCPAQRIVDDIRMPLIRPEQIVVFSAWEGTPYLPDHEIERIERRPPPLRTPDLTAQILAELEPAHDAAAP